MTQPKPLPSQTELHELLDYDPLTGLFCKKAGGPALQSNRRGYRIGSIAGAKNYMAHRVAWKYVHGTDPQGEIDHINGDKSDNRISNLRDVPHHINGKNQKLHITNTTGTPGVYWFRSRSQWTAVINSEGKEHFLGYFHLKQDAVAARKAAEQALGFHENHGRPA